MKDKQTFKSIIESYPDISSYVAFARLIKGKGYNRQKINRLFNQLVDADDYAKSEKGFLLDNLYEYGKNNKRTTN